MSAKGFSVIIEYLDLNTEVDRVSMLIRETNSEYYFWLDVQSSQNSIPHLVDYDTALRIALNPRDVSNFPATGFFEVKIVEYKSKVIETITPENIEKYKIQVSLEKIKKALTPDEYRLLILKEIVRNYEEN